jgi:hypothetical protein
MAVYRGSLVTVGQIAFYEQVKQVLLASGYFKDNILTHFSSSFVAGSSKNFIFRMKISCSSRCRCNFIDNAIRCDENSDDECTTRNL